jgi:hypothetical protein
MHRQRAHVHAAVVEHDVDDAVMDGISDSHVRILDGYGHVSRRDILRADSPSSRPAAKKFRQGVFCKASPIHNQGSA